MKQLTELLTYRALHFKLSQVGQDTLTDMVLEDDDYAKTLPVKNVCAKLSTQLSDRIDNTIGILEISKRRFIEAAIIAALDEADRVMAEVNITEYMPASAFEKEAK